MAEATPLLHGLPDEISIWEILVRLLPESLLRCRAVSPAWRRAVSAHGFLLAHHARQPSLPLLCADSDDQSSTDIVACDHRRATDKLHSVAQLDDGPGFSPVACCDGLLVLRSRDRSAPSHSICNPVTRQHAPLLLPDDFELLGMYPHSPTGEYRLLLYGAQKMRNVGFYVFTVGSAQPPRHIGRPPDELMSSLGTVLFRGSLHWHTRDLIAVFDTAAELLRQMRSPIAPGHGNAGLFETGGMLAMFSLNEEKTVVDIWVMQDYEGQVWASKARVELPIAEMMVQFEDFAGRLNLVAASLDGHVLLLVNFNDGWLHQVDINGKLVASLSRRFLRSTRLRLKQSLVSHTFFPALEGYHVNAWPFI